MAGETFQRCDRSVNSDCAPDGRAYLYLPKDIGNSRVKSRARARVRARLSVVGCLWIPAKPHRQPPPIT